MYENITKNISGRNSKMKITVSWDVMQCNLLDKYYVSEESLSYIFRVK
jgi:hypothetical protein